MPERKHFFCIDVFPKVPRAFSCKQGEGTLQISKKKRDTRQKDSKMKQTGKNTCCKNQPCLCKQRQRHEWLRRISTNASSRTKVPVAGCWSNRPAVSTGVITRRPPPHPTHRPALPSMIDRAQDSFFAEIAWKLDGMGKFRKWLHNHVALCLTAGQFLRYCAAKRKYSYHGPSQKLP